MKNDCINTWSILSNGIVKAYGDRILEDMNSKLTLVKFFPVKKLSVQEKRRMSIEHKWHERKVARARRSLDKLGVSASELCDCDY
jgi:hypothetical protein